MLTRNSSVDDRIGERYRLNHAIVVHVQAVAYTGKGKGKGKGLDTCYSATYSYMSQTRD